MKKLILKNNMEKIITEYVHPPIPLRHKDWVAYFDGDEECGLRGWGHTKDEAINNLKNEII